jgi:peroxiredoxin
MGRAARMRRERRAAAVALPPPVGVRRTFDRRRAVLAGIGAVAAGVAVLVAVLVLTRPSAQAPPQAPASASDRNAPAALRQAADRVGFHPNVEPGVGRMESNPASAATPPTTDLLPAGTKAPSFTLGTPTGERVSLADYRGKAVLLEFFATWCPHCAAEAPHVRRLAESLPGSRFAFVSVNADGEDAASVFAFHRYFGLPYPALLDPSAQPGSFHQPGAAGPVTTRYRVGAYPTFYVLDPHGRITWRSDGEQPDAKLRQELEQAARRA